MYLDPDVFFAKPGLPEFHKSTAEKKHIFLDHVFFQSRACLSFITAVRIKPFFRAWKLFFFAPATQAKFVGLCSQGKEKRMRRQNALKARVLYHNGQSAGLHAWRFEVRIPGWASKRVCQYVVFLVSCSLPFTITPRAQLVRVVARPGFIPQGVTPHTRGAKKNSANYSVAQGVRTRNNFSDRRMF